MSKPAKKTKQGSKTKPDAKSVAAKSKATPLQRTLDKLKESGLGKEDIKDLSIRPMTEAQSASLGLSRSGAGFQLPYMDEEGNELDMFRYRYFDTEVLKGFAAGSKLRKYDQGRCTDPEIYLPQNVTGKWSDVMVDLNTHLCITEGELKAASACKFGFATIAVGGVFSFGRKKRRQKLIPGLQKFDWRGRKVYIVYDSDAITKPLVLMAENRLARLLVDEGAFVYVVRLPPDGEKKVGLDDYLVKHGAEAFQTLVDETQEWGPSEELHKLNAEFAFVHDSGLVAEIPTEERPQPKPYRRNDFVQGIVAPRKIMVEINGKTKILSAGAEWLDWVNRRVVERITYRPGEPIITSRNELNFWTGYGCAPVPGDITPFTQFMEYLFPNPIEHEYIECWFAYPLQNPSQRSNHAVVVWSEKEGNGKTLLGSIFARIHGRANSSEITQAELHSDFNGPLVKKTFIQATEVCGEKDSYVVADKLKTIITGEDIVVNEKGIPHYVVPNLASLYMTSNHPNAVFLGAKSRRYAVFHVTADPWPSARFTEFCSWLDNGGLSFIFHHLLAKDLSNYDAKGHAMKTEAFHEMVVANSTQLQRWAYELRTNTDTTLAVGNKTTPGSFFTTEQLLRIFSQGQQTKITDKGMAVALREQGFKVANNKGLVRIPGTDLRLRLWVIRDELRAANMSAGEIGAAYAEQIGVGKVSKFARGGAA